MVSLRSSLAVATLLATLYGPTMTIAEHEKFLKVCKKLGCVKLKEFDPLEEDECNKFCGRVLQFVLQVKSVGPDRILSNVEEQEPGENVGPIPRDKGLGKARSGKKVPFSADAVKVTQVTDNDDIVRKIEHVQEPQLAKKERVKLQQQIRRSKSKGGKRKAKGKGRSGNKRKTTVYKGAGVESALSVAVEQTLNEGPQSAGGEPQERSGAAASSMFASLDEEIGAAKPGRSADTRKKPTTIQAAVELDIDANSEQSTETTKSETTEAPPETTAET